MAELLERRTEDGKGICPFCDIQFKPKSDHQKFCCDNHRKSFHKAGGIGAKQRRAIAEVVREVLKEMGVGVAA